nr:EVE domain-containing protein [Hymenobacter sp. 15J16-1T3B]
MFSLNSREQVNFWLVKSEPSAYSFADLERDGRTDWTGVRNHQARACLARMQPDDLVLVYHSVTDKEVVGVARVVGAPAPDRTAEPGTPWVAVDLAPHQRLPRPVSLAAIKADARLQQIGLLRQSRLSVMSLTPEEFDLVLALGH